MGKNQGILVNSWTDLLVQGSPSSGLQASTCCQISSSIRVEITGLPWLAQVVNNLPAMQIWVWSLGQEDTLENEMATHSAILAWEAPWTEEPGGLQSTGLQRVGHNWVTNTFTFKVHNKHNALESSWNHPRPTPQSVEKLSSTKSVPGAKKAVDHCSNWHSSTSLQTILDIPSQANNLANDMWYRTQLSSASHRLKRDNR